MSRPATPNMLDKLAEGVAAGVPWKQAATAAGWKPSSNSYYRLKTDPDFQRRIERFRRRREGSGMSDLGDMVGRLLKASRPTTDDVVGQTLSHLCLVSAAQLLLETPERDLADPLGRETDYLRLALAELAIRVGLG